MDKKTKVKARIFGNEYSIVGNESYEYIHKVCTAVDKKMRELSSKTPLKPLKISVLTAVDFCDEYYKASQKLLENEAELFRLRDEVKALHKECDFLKSEIKSQRGKFKR